MNKPSHSHDPTLIKSLWQVHYWLGRFEISQDIEHYKIAELHAKVAIDYLPLCFQELTLIGLCNLYLSMPTQSIAKSEVTEIC